MIVTHAASGGNAGNRRRVPDDGAKKGAPRWSAPATGLGMSIADQSPDWARFLSAILFSCHQTSTGLAMKIEE